MSPQVNDRPTISAGPAAILPGLERLGWRIEDLATPDGSLWVTAGADSEVHYPDSGHELMESVEELSPWFHERNRLVAAALAADRLPGHLIDVGAGNGGVATHLRRLGVDVVAVEPGRVGAGCSARRGVPTVCGMFEDLHLPDGAVEALAALDVIEHLAEPGPLLAEIHRSLEPGGRVVVSVPAMPALWSRADELAGHHRRYTRSQLIAELAGAGFETRSCHHAFAALVPVVACLRALPDRLGRRRSAGRQDEVGTRQVAGYGSVRRRASELAFAGERALRSHVELRFGTSLLGVFTRVR